MNKLIHPRGSVRAAPVWVGLCGLALTLAAQHALAGEGWIELRQQDMPITLREPGLYRVVENLSLSGVETNGITVVAADVSLDLNGFALTGDPYSTRHGIRIEPWAVNVTVENGSVTGWGLDGIDAGYEEESTISTSCVFRALHITGNALEGLDAGKFALVDRVVSMANGHLTADGGREQGCGMRAGEGSIVMNCTAYRNWAHGILCRSSGIVRDCRIVNNGHDGIKTDAACVISRCIVYGAISNGDGVEVVDGSFVGDCIAMNNDDDGIKTRGSGYSAFVRNVSCGNANDGLSVGLDGSILMDNVAVDNADDGLSCSGGWNVMVGNLGYLNGFRDNGSAGGGVRAVGDFNRLENNHCIHNEHGVSLPGTDNLAVGNSAVDNTLGAFYGASDDRVGTLRSQPASAGPWDNLAY